MLCVSMKMDSLNVHVHNISPHCQSASLPLMNVPPSHSSLQQIKWSGRNQEGAGTTAGEEVEQVNSYLSRCALTTKYMSKAGIYN